MQEQGLFMEILPGRGHLGIFLMGWSESLFWGFKLAMWDF